MCVRFHLSWYGRSIILRFLIDFFFLLILHEYELEFEVHAAKRESEITV
jgi:hypothetical protein